MQQESLHQLKKQIWGTTQVPDAKGKEGIAPLEPLHAMPRWPPRIGNAISQVLLVPMWCFNLGQLCAEDAALSFPKGFPKR